MIQSVHILTINGLPLFSGCYEEDINCNSDLLAGLLSAIFLFARKIGEGTIRCIELENKKYVCSVLGDLLFAVCVNDTEDANAIRVVGQIQTEFMKRYQKIIDQGNTMNSGKFSNFSNILDEIVGKSIRNPSNGSENAFINLERLDSIFEDYVKQKLDRDPLYEKKFKKFMKKLKV